MYECYECGVDRGGSGMREDGNCIDCGPVTKKKLKRRVEELIEAHDRLAAENAELRKCAKGLKRRHNTIAIAYWETCAALAAANATLDVLREQLGPLLATLLGEASRTENEMKSVRDAWDLLHPKPAHHPDSGTVTQPPPSDD